MKRRTALSIFAALPFLSRGAFAAASVGAAALTDDQVFRLAWTPTDSRTPLIVTASIKKAANPTESVLTFSLQKNGKVSQRFTFSEVGKFLFAVPLQGTQLLATIWLGPTAYLVKIIRAHGDKVDVVLDERSQTFECIYSDEPDLNPKIITSDTNGFPSQPSHWIARVFVWDRDKFRLDTQCSFKARLSR